MIGDQVKELVREGGIKDNPKVSSLETQRLWWYGWGSGFMERFHSGEYRHVNTDSENEEAYLTADPYPCFLSLLLPLLLCLELYITDNRLYIATILDKLKNLSQNMISKFISHLEAWLAMEKDSGAIRQPTPSQTPFNTAPLPSTSWDPGQVTSPPCTSLSSGGGDGG